MVRWFSLIALAFVVLAAPAQAAGLTGQYLEARTCDVWAAPCFANAETLLSGKHAVLAWKVEKGELDQVRLDGLSVVAVVASKDNLGLEQTGPARAVLIVDSKATAAQREALIRLAKKQAGKLLDQVLAVESAAIELDVLNCKEGGCARLDAGKARIETRCIDEQHEKVCGNESAYYPPLCKGVTARPALALEHSFSGKNFNETWKDSSRRGAYLGSFSVR